MKIYALMVGCNYEGPYTLGLFSTLELAQKEESKFYTKSGGKIKASCGYDYTEIQEFLVDDIE